MADGTLKWFLPYVLVSTLQYQFAKDSLSYSSPFVAMALRYLLAGSILFAISRKLVLDKTTLAISALLSVSTLFWILGLAYVSTGDSAVLSFTMPLFAIPMGFIVLKEKPTIWEVLGAIVGFLGVGIYSVTLMHGPLLIGSVLTIINAIFWAGYSTLLRRAREREPTSFVGTQFILGSLPFVVGSVFYPQANLVPRFFADVTYLGIFGGAVQLFFWNAMLKLQTIGRVTTMAYAVPATTVAIQSLETFTLPSLTSVVGATIMFLGIFISNNRDLFTRSKLIRV